MLSRCERLRLAHIFRLFGGSRALRLSSRNQAINLLKVPLKSRGDSCNALSNGKSSTRTVSSANVKEDVKTPTRTALEVDAYAANTSMQPISVQANMISRLQMRPGTPCVI